MTHYGYWLSSEEHAPADLIRYAVRAEQVGFDGAMISDHYHPWIRRQGHAPFAWTVLGAIAQATTRLTLGTGVTCPLIRYHPAIIAQAAATMGCLMPGRFFLGLGTGENLNEHIMGQHWPTNATRRAMLADAVALIRCLWEGGQQSYHGDYYQVQNAQIFDLPDPLPPILIAAGGDHSAQLAGRLGDGYMGVGPSKDAIRIFDQNGGRGKPHHGQMNVCWAPTVDEARQTVCEWWPNAGLQGGYTQELSIPAYFEDAARLVTAEQAAQAVACGPDPGVHLAALRAMADAGYDTVYVHQIGPDQAGFFQFYAEQILPRLRS